MHLPNFCFTSPAITKGSSPKKYRISGVVLCTQIPSLVETKISSQGLEDPNMTLNVLEWFFQVDACLLPFIMEDDKVVGARQKGVEHVCRA